jgi:hypothetical protein
VLVGAEGGGELTGQGSPKGLSSQEREELRRLRREVKVRTEEREI